MMAGAHENLETAEHAQHAAHEEGRDNKKIALIISVLALFLAFSETLGKSAQTAALNFQIEASNLWNFFQAKNIRRTMTLVASDMAKLDATIATQDQHKAALAKQIDQWQKTAARYQSEPDAGGPGKGEGTKELSDRAKAMETARDLQLNKYHNFEFASAAFQIGIVLASAAVITGILALAYGAVCVGIGGALLMGAGLFAPELLHDIMHWIEALFAGGGGHH
jgi:hypothetical protein